MPFASQELRHLSEKEVRLDDNDKESLTSLENIPLIPHNMSEKSFIVTPKVITKKFKKKDSGTNPMIKEERSPKESECIQKTLSLSIPNEAPFESKFVAIKHPRMVCVEEIRSELTSSNKHLESTAECKTKDHEAHS